MIDTDGEHPLLTMPRRRWAIIFGLFVLAVCGFIVPVHAAEVPVPDTTLVVDPEPTPTTDGKNPIKPDEKERRIKLTAGLAALAGILIVGVVLGAIIIIWAGRLRRLVREPIPATGRQDPFWFLRPEKTRLPRNTDEIDTTNPEES